MPGRETRSIVVKVDPARAHDLWADFESFPGFMYDVKSVAKTGERTSQRASEKWKGNGRGKQ